MLPSHAVQKYALQEQRPARQVLMVLCLAISLFATTLAVAGKYTVRSLGALSWPLAEYLHTGKPRGTLPTDSVIDSLLVPELSREWMAEYRENLQALLQQEDVAEGCELDLLRVLDECSREPGSRGLCRLRNVRAPALTSALLYGFSHWPNMRQTLYSRMTAHNETAQAMALALASQWKFLPADFKRMQWRFQVGEQELIKSTNTIIRYWFQNPHLAYPQNRRTAFSRTSYTEKNTLSFSLAHVTDELAGLQLQDQGWPMDMLIKHIFDALLSTSYRPEGWSPDYFRLHQLLLAFIDFSYKDLSPQALELQMIEHYPFPLSKERQEQVRILKQLLTGRDRLLEPDRYPDKPELDVVRYLRPVMVRANSGALIHRLRRRDLITNDRVTELARARPGVAHYKESVLERDKPVPCSIGQAGPVAGKHRRTPGLVSDIIRDMRDADAQTSLQLFCRYTHADWCEGSRLLISRKGFNFAYQMLEDEKKHPGLSFARLLKQPYSFNWALSQECRTTEMSGTLGSEQ